MDDESYELDSTTIFKQEADNLTTVQNLEDALSRFGFTKDDKMSRRELVGIYVSVRDVMEPEIFRLANSGQYAAAKDMRGRLTNLRLEFDGLQLNGAAKIRSEQQQLFEKGSKELLQKLQEQQDKSISEFGSLTLNQTSTHNLYKSIDQTKLEQQLSLIKRPNVRYSKRLIELFKAEYGLNKLHQYDEAIKVRKMIDKLLPVEEKRFYDNFEATISQRRKKLADSQTVDQMKFDEMLKTIEWKEIRRRELESKINDQRLKNHEKDMNHAHLLEGKLHAEMTVKPSALWQHRSGYNFTSASLRGQQLMDTVREKKTGTQVFAESLVTRHNFTDIPPDTVTLNNTSDNYRHK